MIRTPAPLRASYPVHRTLTTRWFDNDIYAHLNNSVHYQLFDTVVNGHLLEHALLDLHKSETVFLVVESGCRYFGEIAFPDVVTAGLRVGRLGTSSIRYEVGLFRSDTQQAAAAGHFIHVNVNRQTRQPEPIAPRAKDVLARLVMSG